MGVFSYLMHALQGLLQTAMRFGILNALGPLLTLEFSVECCCNKCLDCKSGRPNWKQGPGRHLLETAMKKWNFQWKNYWQNLKRDHWEQSCTIIYLNLVRHWLKKDIDEEVLRNSGTYNGYGS